jgi:L-fuculose-phosphate aldolase
MSRRLARELVAAARAMNAAGLNQGTSGNLSVRWRGQVLITPTGLAYDELTPEKIVCMAPDGSYTGRWLPSSEWRFHVAILAARPEIGAVLHAHSPYATTLACLGRAIPPFHYMVAVAGGADIRCADYATFGTVALAAHAVAALEGRRACLLANHGMIALGETPKAALGLAIEVEALAAQYWRALQIGEPNLLSAAEMQRVLEKFKGYGRQPQASAKRRRSAAPAGLASASGRP